MSRSTPFACAFGCALLCAAAAFAVTSAKAAAPAPPAAAPATKPGSASATATKPGNTTGSATPTRSGAPSATQSPTTSAAGAAKKGTAARAKTPPKPKPNLNELQQIDWSDLLPENERKKYNPNAPAPVHGPLGEGGPPAVQVVTTAVNADLDQALVKLPGFIVPIGEAKNGVFREFYLVPYIGEDIHVPPPPSNQMVYVSSITGIATEAVHEAYWVTGKMRVETRTTPLGTSAWSLVANKVEQYEY